MTWNIKSASRGLDFAHRAASITLRRLLESLAPPNLLTSNRFVGRVPRGSYRSRCCNLFPTHADSTITFLRPRGAHRTPLLSRISPYGDSSLFEHTPAGVAATHHSMFHKPPLVAALVALTPSLDGCCGNDVEQLISLTISIGNNSSLNDALIPALQLRKKLKQCTEEFVATEVTRADPTANFIKLNCARVEHVDRLVQNSPECREDKHYDTTCTRPTLFALHCIQHMQRYRQPGVGLDRNRLDAMEGKQGSVWYMWCHSACSAKIERRAWDGQVPTPAARPSRHFFTLFLPLRSRNSSQLVERKGRSMPLWCCCCRFFAYMLITTYNKLTYRCLLFTNPISFIHVSSCSFIQVMGVFGDVVVVVLKEYEDGVLHPTLIIEY
jgi:hypothetical protein